MNAGYDIDPLIMTHFENKETLTFCSRNDGNNANLSTNIHALNILHLLPDYPNQVQVKKQVITTLLDNREYSLYWIDERHISPYYATAHVLIGLLGEKEDRLVHECRHTIDWILHNQKDDGSWGFYESGTVEETAYAMTALLHYHRYEPVAPDILHQGAAYLAHTHQGIDSTYPELWLSKSTYAPHDIARSAVLAALILYNDTFGHKEY